jgi:oxidase EvaA
MDMIDAWFAAMLDDAECQVENIGLSQSAEWSVQHGFLTHRSKGFFTVVGLDWMSPDGTASQRPYFDQRVPGTLGFLMRHHEQKHQLLVQAKLEPGNVGLVQLAPTCQATDSNVKRLHGGQSPPFANCFSPGSANVVYDVAHSEQGTRFFRKRNRNVLVFTEYDKPIPPTHRWLDADDVLDLLWHDYLVNTDARSVLVCAPWQQLVNRVPFSRHREGFGTELMRSASSASRHIALDQVKARIQEARITVEEPKVVPLQDLRSWHFNDQGLVPVNGDPLCIRQIRITVKGREVPAWDQPIIDSGCEGSVDLVCGRLSGVLHFLFRARAEAGLTERIELTPTHVVEPGDGHGEVLGAQWQGRVVAQCRQSEEGGRFYRDTNCYRIVDVGQASDGGHMSYWLTLGDIRRLLDEPGWLTNESRSSLSLLLPWM